MRKVPFLFVSRPSIIRHIISSACCAPIFLLNETVSLASFNAGRFIAIESLNVQRRSTIIFSSDSFLYNKLPCFQVATDNVSILASSLLVSAFTLSWDPFWRVASTLLPACILTLPCCTATTMFLCPGYALISKAVASTEVVMAPECIRKGSFSA